MLNRCGHRLRTGSAVLTLIALAESVIASVWRPSVRPSVCLSRLFLTLIQHTVHTQCDSPWGAARDAASVHFRPSIRMTDILVCSAAEIPLFNEQHNINNISSMFQR